MEIPGFKEWAKKLQLSLSSQWQLVRNILLQPEALVQSPTNADQVGTIARETAPIVWLVGKVQSGKTSIVKAITNATNAEIGHGYKPCTRNSAIFDFPNEAPLIRFLDTRGLGEANYDAAEDIAFHEASAHVLLAVMKALDPQQDSVLRLIHEVRRRNPKWPVIGAQTTLHDAYSSRQTHLTPYPYHDLTMAARNPAVPSDLVRSLLHQRSLFDNLKGEKPCFVALDFTKEEDGFEPKLYGLSALFAALEQSAPLGLLAALRAHNGQNALNAAAHPKILGYAAAAAAADVVPAAGLVAVPAVQAKMLHALARLYNVSWNRAMLTEFGGCLGAGTLSRLLTGFGLRQLTKFIPVYGQTAGAAAAAAMSFATTYAMGKAACYFLDRQHSGLSDPEGVGKTYSEALAAAFSIFKAKDKGA